MKAPDISQLIQLDPSSWFKVRSTFLGVKYTYRYSKDGRLYVLYLNQNSETILNVYDTEDKLIEASTGLLPLKIRAEYFRTLIKLRLNITQYYAVN